MNFNERIVKLKYNEYGGSEQKETAIFDDGCQYLIKIPDPTRELNRDLSYINNAISEYVACHILESIGFEVQKTLLGTYTTPSGKEKVVCACEDIRRFGEQLYELEKISLSSEEIHRYGKMISFEKEELLLSKIEDISTREFINFYYDLFVADALISNPDRHNGNIGFLSNSVTSRIAPVYDCGSALHPLWDDSELSEELAYSETMNACSIIQDDSGKRINYHSFLTSGQNNKVAEALTRILPKINLSQISEIIESTPYISDKRKSFYKTCIESRYERTLIPAIKKIFAKNMEIAEGKDDSWDYFGFYKRVIEPIKITCKYGEWREYKLENGQEIACSKAGKNHAFCFKDGILQGVISTRSNNNDVRYSVNVLKNLGYDNNLSCSRSKNKNTKSRSPVLDSLIESVGAEEGELTEKTECKNTRAEQSKSDR